MSVCCVFPQHPHRPMPVYTTKRASVPEPLLAGEPPSRKPAPTQLYPSASGLGRPAASTRPPAGRHEAREADTPEPPAPPRQRSAGDPGPDVQRRQNRLRCASLGGPQAVSKARGLGHAQAPAKRPDVTAPAPPARWAPVAQPHLQAAGRKRRAPSPDETCHHPRKKARPSPSRQPHKSTGGTHVGLCQSPCRPARASAGGATGAAPVTGKTTASVQSAGLQPLRPRPHLDTLRPCTAAPCPAPQQAPGQPLRMVFSRLAKGGWRSRFLAAPSLPPPERPARPGHGPPVTHLPEGPCAPVPRSVLHDDLQLSSSSEESDRE